MTDIVAIASNAVAAYQRALSTTSNNIANVATVGYSRQEVALQANPVMRSGNLFLGTGVTVDHIKRNYNAFIESNVRNSTSDLASQEPMVNYTNRVVDVLGGQTIGLTSALDQFFSSARDLSTDPASSVMRGSFVRDAQGAASRFNELSSQLDLVQEESTQSVKTSVDQMNTLTTQLAGINKQLTGHSTEAAQPPELLDQRDLLLKTLAGFVRINTSFKPNGTVTVSLGPDINKDIVVAGNSAMQIGAQINPDTPDKVVLVLDPYGKATSLSGISSGQLAGLIAFKEQVLGSTRSTLDNLAKTFATQVNAVHAQGIDGYGNTAGDLFKFDPAAKTAAAAISVAFDDPMKVSAAAQFRVIEGANNTGSATAQLKYNESPPAPQGPADITLAFVNNSHPSAAKNYNVSASLPLGVATIANGMKDVSVFLNSMVDGQQLQVMTRDGRQILGSALSPDLQTSLITPENGFAAGAGFSSQYLNQSGLSGYKGMTVFYGARADVQTEPSFISAGTSAGASISAITFGARPSTQDFSSFSVSVAGTLRSITPAPVTATLTALAANLQTQLRALDNSSTDLSVQASGSTLTVVSASGRAISNLALTPALDKRLPPVLQGAPMLVGQTLGMAAGTFTLNGVALNALPAAATGQTLQAGDIASWLNAQTSSAAAGTPLSGITATATNVIRVADSQLKLNQYLSLNGISIAGRPYANKSDLISAINNANTGSSPTGVSASLSGDGELVLTSANGKDIAIASGAGTAENTLGLSAGTFSGRISLSRPLVNGQDTPIELGFGLKADGTYGQPSDLAKLGFRTGATVKGAVKDDLLVFVTGAGSASVSASYAGTPVNAKQSLRGQPMEVRFSNGNTTIGESSGDLYYAITDSKTGTEVARRKFDRTALQSGLQFQNLKLSFSSAPLAGDVFTLDGNRDGTGNNENMLVLAKLENKPLVGNKTLANAYLDHVNDMGNIARQASIAKSALTVVHDQATAARDAVSGVSLDAEAADLIRFQQAYQAAAKVLQIASTLFDNVLAIR